MAFSKNAFDLLRVEHFRHFLPTSSMKILVYLAEVFFQRCTFYFERFMHYNECPCFKDFHSVNALCSNIVSHLGSILGGKFDLLNPILKIHLILFTINQ